MATRDGRDATLSAETHLFATMYQVAQEHRDFARKPTGRGNAEMMGSEIKNAMISIVFALTCLEGYINWVARAFLGTNWLNYKDTSPEGKWKGVANAITQKKFGKMRTPFSEKEPPFKSFLELVQLRNGIVHLEPEEWLGLEEGKYGLSNVGVNQINAEVAEQACQTVEGMITKLHEVIEVDLPWWLRKTQRPAESLE